MLNKPNRTTLYRNNAEDYGSLGENRGGTSMETAWLPHKTSEIETLFAGSGGVKPNSSPLAGYPGGPGRIRVLEDADFESFLTAQDMPTNLDAFDGDPKEHHTKTEFTRDEADLVETRSPGTGGYGDPLYRDPQKVLEGVLIKSVVSPDVAYEVYGVIFDDNGDEITVNEEATEQRRADIIETRLAESTFPAEDE